MKENLKLNEKDLNNKTENKNQPTYKFYEKGIGYGLISGLLMSLYLLLLRGVGEGGNMPLKFLTFLILGGVITYAINERRGQNKKGELFRKGILTGVFISFVAASTILLFETAVYLLNYEWLVPMFKNKITGVIEFAAFSSIMFLQTMLFGLILTFIALQYYKRPQVA